MRANRAASLGLRTLHAQLELARCVRTKDPSRAANLAREVERESRLLQLRSLASTALELTR